MDKQAQDHEEVRALVHSGGGGLGPYEVGVTEALMEAGRRYQIYSGVSVGAINAAALAMYPSSSWRSAIDNLKNLWLNTHTENVRRGHRPFGLLHAYHRMSIYDSSPLRELLTGAFSIDRVRESGNELFCGAVSMVTNEYVVFDKTYDDYVSALMASSSTPMILSLELMPVRGGSQLFTDGGVKCATPIRAAIKAGATDIDVVLTEPELMSHQEVFNNIVDVGFRLIAMMAHNIFNLDLQLTVKENELVKAGVSDKRFVNLNIYRPSNPLPADALSFEPEQSSALMKLGYEDGCKALAV